MAGELNAQQLCIRVRTDLNLWGQDQLRDGFEDDALDPALFATTPSILEIINNSVIPQLLDSGYCKCPFTLAIQPDSGNYNPNEYAVSNVVHEIVHAVYSIPGLESWQPLSRKTILQLDTQYPGWNDFANTSPGPPQYYYNSGDIIGFAPGVPDQPYTVQYLADTLPSDLIGRSDVPTFLSARYHYLIGKMAALEYTITDSENDAAQRRLPSLQQAVATGFQGLKELIETRGDDFDEQVSVHDPRGHWRTI